MAAPDFVGREGELLALRRRLDRALAGEPVVSLVEGEAGMGKTRLAQELAAEAAARGVRVVWVEADEAERPALGLCDRVVRTVGSAAAPDPTLPPSERRWEVLEALVDVLREAAPILVVLDDLHWADDASRWAIERVPRRLAGAPMCLLGTARPDEPGAESLAGLRRQGDVVVVRGLAPDAVAELVRALPAAGPVDAERLAARTGGNPLFVRELVALGDEGALPHAVRDVLVRNLRRLEPAAQETLTVLALAGPSASVEVCAAALGAEPVTVAEHLDRAAAAGIVRWSGDGTGFRHPLYGTAAAALAAPARRRELHAALADAWEGDGERGERGDRAARAAVVTHRLAALPLGDAASAGRDALRLAGDLTGAGDAGRAAEVARAALDTLRAAGGVPRDLLARLALAQGEALWATGAAAAASAALEEAAELARDGDDAELAAACEAAAARFVNPFVLDAPRIRRLLACEAALPAGDDPVRVDVLSRLAVLYTARPNLVATGHVHGDAAVAMARRLGDPERLVTALTDRNFVPLGVDGSTGRREISEEIVALGDRLGRPDLAFAGREWQFEDAFERADRAGAERALAALDVTAVVMPSPEWRYKALSRRSMLRLCDDDRAAALDMAASWGSSDARCVPRRRRSAWSWRSARGSARSGGHPIRGRTSSSTGCTSGSSRRPRSSASRPRRPPGRGATPTRSAAWSRTARRSPPTSSPATGACRWWRCWATWRRVSAPRSRPPRCARPSAPTPAGWRSPSVRRWRSTTCSAGWRAWTATTRRPTATTAPPSPCWRRSRRRRSCRWPRRIWPRSRARAGDRAGAAAARAEAEDLAARAGVTLPDGEGDGRATAPVRPSRRASLRRDGAAWSIGSPTGGGEVPDSQGVAHLARLLATPGREIAATELAGMAGTAPPAADLGPALDARAKREYRRRLAELRADIDEAESANDGERAARARVELDALMDELRRAVGLGGRDRPTGSGAERARVNVTRSVRRAIVAVGRVDPALGAHLDRSVRTGSLLRLRPRAGRGAGLVRRRRNIVPPRRNASWVNDSPRRTRCPTQRSPKPTTPSTCSTRSTPWSPASRRAWCCSSAAAPSGAWPSCRCGGPRRTRTASSPTTSPRRSPRSWATRSRRH